MNEQEWNDLMEWNEYLGHLAQAEWSLRKAFDLGDGTEGLTAEQEQAYHDALEAIATLRGEQLPAPPNDQTGHPWPGCICNDARYERGHMEACPCYGLPPDRPPEDRPPR